MNKYNAKKKEVDGFLFDSTSEANRYSDLKLAERAGNIRNLELQPKFSINLEGRHICDYFADFRYYDCDKEEIIIEDVKGMATDVYKLKKKLVEAVYKIKITEIR